MSPRLSIRKQRWWVTSSKVEVSSSSTVENKLGKGLSVSQDETASDTSSFQPAGSVLEDFALPMWNNPMDASEHAVTKNANHATDAMLLYATKVPNGPLVRETQMLPNLARAQSTPENMLIVFGEDDSTNNNDDDDISINEADFVINSPESSRRKYAVPRPCTDDHSLDIKTAYALQEQEMIRLALKISLYDV